MKAKIDRGLLLSKLSKVMKFVPSRTVIPAFDNMRLSIKNNVMDMVSGDGNMQCRMNINVKSDVDFSFCVPAKLFFKTISLFHENELIITLKSENKLELKSGKSKYNITLDCFENDFPMLNIINPENEITLHQFYLKNAVKSANKFTDDESANNNISGINISEVDSEIVFTGLDNKVMCRAAIRPMSISKWDSIMLPGETASKLSSMLDDKGEISIVHSGEKIKFFTSMDSDDFFEITTASLNSKFPNSEKLFAKKPQNTYILNTIEVLGAVKRLKLYAPDGTAPVKFSVKSENELVLFSEDVNYNKSGNEDIEFKHENIEKHLEKTFVADNLIKILSLIEETDFYLIFEESNQKPSFIIPKTNSDEKSMYSFLLTSILS